MQDRRGVARRRAGTRYESISRIARTAIGTVLSLWTVCAMAGSAQALKFDYQIGNQSSAGGITVSDGGQTATATGWGGITNPQNTLNPANPGASGAQNLGTNIGTALGFGRGIGCGTIISVSQCDLIAPGGEDALLISFSAPMEITRIYGTLLENPDDISAWSWNGANWDLIGTDDCPPDGFFNNCGSFGQYDGEDIGHVDLIGGGTLLPSNPTSYLMVVAENTNASAFRLGYIEATVIPEPGTAVLVGAGMWLLARRRRGAQSG